MEIHSFAPRLSPRHADPRNVGRPYTFFEVNVRICQTIKPLHSVPESLYSFQFRFSQISVFCNKKFKKIREIAEFIPNQLRFHEKNLANFHDMEISLVVLPCHFIG